LAKNLTIGILLCADKNDALLRISLPKNNPHIVAAKYQPIPSKREAINCRDLEGDEKEFGEV